MAAERVPKREHKAESKELIAPGTHRRLPRPGYYIPSINRVAWHSISGQLHSIGLMTEIDCPEIFPEQRLGLRDSEIWESCKAKYPRKKKLRETLYNLIFERSRYALRNQRESN